MKQKRIPARMCISCRTMKPKKELIRVVNTPDHTVVVDETGKKPGRGAYICRERACIELAKKQRRLERNFENADCAHVYPVLLSMTEEIGGT